MDPNTTSPSEVNAFIMDRVSSSPQEDRSGKRRQAGLAEKECLKRGWPVSADRSISDTVSAFKEKNFDTQTNLGMFLELAKKGMLPPLSVLVMESLDRWSRALLSRAMQRLKALIDAGVDVCVVRPPIYLTKGFDDNPAQLNVVQNELYRANRESERKREFATEYLAELLAKAEKGIPANFAFRIPPWIEYVEVEGEPTFRFDEEVSAVVRRIIAMYRADKSCHEIASTLNVEHVKPLRGGREWFPGTIWKLLQSRELHGDFKMSGKVFKGYVPALITEEEHNVILTRLFQNSRRTRRSSTQVNNLFPGLVYCRCGHRARVSKSENGEFYYACTGYGGVAEPGTPCTCDYKGNRRLLRDAVEQDFFAGYLLRFPLELMSERDEELQLKMTELRAKIDKFTKKLAVLKKQETVWDSEDYVPQVQDATNARREARAELERLESKNFMAKGSFNTWKSMMGEFGLDLENCDYRKLNISSDQLETQLGDNTLRRKAALAMPRIILGLEIDFSSSCYRVWTLSKTKTEWIDVSGMVDQMMPEPIWTPEELQERIAQMRGRPRQIPNRPPLKGRKKPRDFWSDERRAKVSLMHERRKRIPLTPEQLEARQRFWTPEKRAAASARMKTKIAVMKSERCFRLFRLVSR